MNKTLLELIKSKLELAELCKDNSFHTMMLYSETLPSLLLQCIGYIENTVDRNKAVLNSKDVSKIGWNFSAKTLNRIIEEDGKVLSDKWDPIITQNKDILNEYKKLKVFKSIGNQKEFDVTVNFLLHQQDLYEFVKIKIEALKDYRNDFAHGRINARNLSIISKHDYYVYYGILLVINESIHFIYK